MSIKYYEAPDIKQLATTIITELNFTHINPQHIYCYRSRGSKSKRTIARIHSLEKLWQKALKTHPRYLIEVITERYDKLDQTDKEKVLIHELLHIPKGFSGGFRPHKGYINKKTINKLHKTFQRHKKIFKEGYGKGTGYGLYLIKKICEVYGWNTQETGKQNKGAQFTIAMPKPNYKLH